MSSVFKPGESFIEGASEPHFVQNKGDIPTVVWVMASWKVCRPRSGSSDPNPQGLMRLIALCMRACIGSEGMGMVLRS